MNAPDSAVRECFRRQFQHVPSAVATAPGCVELLGHQTEAHEGLVLAAAVGHPVRVAVSPRADGWVELAWAGREGREKFRVNALEARTGAAWADPVKAVLWQLRRRGVHFSGFNAAVHAALPCDAGLHEVAALEIATLLAVRQLHPFTLTETALGEPPRRDARGRVASPAAAERLHLARLCLAAEREFLRRTGSLAGLLTILGARPFHAMLVDCRFETVAWLPLVGEVLVVCDSGVPPGAADPGGAAMIRSLFDSAARWMQAGSLRSVDPAYLKENRARLSRREFECAYHVVGELQRVVYAERALREEDHGQFGHFLVQSHESARDQLRDTTPELDLLVELAASHSGCLGACVTGPGFGGSTVNLVPYHEVQRFVADVAAAFEARSGRKLKPLICPMAGGAE